MIKKTLGIDDAVAFIKTAEGRSLAEVVNKAVEHGMPDVTIIAEDNGDGTYIIFAEGDELEDLAKEAMTKAVTVDEEQRYTLAPFFMPGMLDAHHEHTDANELGAAFQKYMSLPDGDIRLQHNKDIIAGRRVDGVVWPFEVTLPLTKADGTSTEYTFPAGTPFLGVKWEPYAWDMIKDGRLNGYSMGGTSKRLEVDLPEKL